MAKRRKLPDEDLAAAVAEMIHSPITRANLSFLEPIGSVATEEESEQEALGRDSIKPMGFIEKPVGSALIPSLPTPVPLSVPAPSVTSRPPPASPPAAASQPIQQTLALPIPTTLWQAESLGVVFPANRVRRIQQAQDALSPVEERVYNLLWGQRSTSRDDYRLTQFSLQRISNEARINLKTVRLLVPRLIEKGFVEVAAEADVRRNIPTTYRVWGYTAILERLRQLGRQFVVKTGRGVFFAHPVHATVAPFLPSEITPEPTGFRNLSPMGSDPAPVGLKPMGPMGFNVLKPMGSTGTLSLDIYIGNTKDTTTTEAPAAASTEPAFPEPFEELALLCRELFATEPDHQILSAMVADCHQRALATTGQPATADEILYFARLRAQVIRKAPNIRNHIAVLRKALPECFAGPTFRAYRSAAIPKRDFEPQSETENLKLWTRVSQRHKTEQGYDLKAIAEDPELDVVGREQARQMLERVGRYSSIGI